MSRTTTTLVQARLGDDYGSDLSALLQPSVDAATITTDRIVVLAARKSLSLTSAELEMIERLLGCHYYQMSDPSYTSRSTSGASGSFRGQTTSGFEATLYGQMALRMDWTGSLAALDKRQFAGGFHLGKIDSEKLTYEQRNGTVS